MADRSPPPPSVAKATLGRMTDGPALGMCFPRSLPPGLVIEFAERLEHDGLDQLWVIEDCFYTAGVSLAAAAMARTARLGVGIGILPAVARNPAVTAMEFATLAGLGPGRLIGGIGHGVQDWMGQMGARTRSPLTTLEEVVDVVRRLLAGEEVTFAGGEVTLDQVKLEQPPDQIPPVLAGVRGPKSLALAGRVADGIVLAEGVGPAYTRWAIECAAAPPDFRTAVFSSLCVTAEREQAHVEMAPFVAELVADPKQQGIRLHPHFDDLQDRYAEGGVHALATMPADWWLEIGAIGTIDDARQHIQALHDAGADDVCLFPAPELAIARSQLDDVAALVGR
jgi:5,10-methylenetetrahydromethanopterin reductase